MTLGGSPLPRSCFQDPNRKPGISDSLPFTQANTPSTVKEPITLGLEPGVHQEP